MASPDYTAVRKAIMDGDTDTILQELVDCPQGSLVECWNGVVASFAHCGTPDTRRLEVMLKAFTSAGMGINDVDNCGNTPLVTAISNKLTTLCQVLIKSGAGVNECPPDAPYSPFAVALRQQEWNIVRLLQRHGAQLVGTHQSWDISVFNAVIQNTDVRLFQFLLTQFQKNKKIVPWNAIMSECAERSPTFSEKVLPALCDYIREDVDKEPVCPFLQCLRLAESKNLDQCADFLICQHPRILQSGLHEGSVTVQRYHQAAKDPLQSKRQNYLTNTLNRCAILDKCGPEWEVRIHNQVYKKPAHLQMMCRSTILKRLQPNARAKIQQLHFPQALKTYLRASTNRTDLNLDKTTRYMARKQVLKFPPEIRMLLRTEPHPEYCYCSRQEWTRSRQPDDRSFRTPQTFNSSANQRFFSMLNLLS